MVLGLLPMWTLTIPSTLVGAFMTRKEPTIFSNLVTFMAAIVAFVQGGYMIGCIHYARQAQTLFAREIAEIPDDEEVRLFDERAAKTKAVRDRVTSYAQLPAWTRYTLLSGTGVIILTCYVLMLQVRPRPGGRAERRRAPPSAAERRQAPPMGADGHDHRSPLTRMPSRVRVMCASCAAALAPVQTLQPHRLPRSTESVPVRFGDPRHLLLGPRCSRGARLLAGMLPLLQQLGGARHGSCVPARVGSRLRDG